MAFNQDAMEAAYEAFLAQVREFIGAVTPDTPFDTLIKLEPHIERTPYRVARMFAFELLAGYRLNPAEILSTEFEDGYSSVVLVRDIHFYSLCAHHMLPFFGKAHVAYIPSGKVVGLSKLARLVECFARRLQIQEKMGDQIADALTEHLKPKGAACVIRAEHLCMSCRGIQKSGATTVTSSIRGAFLDEGPARAELMSLIHERS